MTEMDKKLDSYTPPSDLLSNTTKDFGKYPAAFDFPVSITLRGKGLEELSRLIRQNLDLEA